MSRNKNIGLDNRRVVSSLLNYIKTYSSKILPYHQLNEIAAENMSNKGKTYCLPRISNNAVIILFYNIYNSNDNSTDYYSVFIPCSNILLPIASIQFEPIDINAYKTIYDGTIFIGTMVKNNCISTYYIENCLAMNGKPYEINTPFDIMYSKLSKTINNNTDIRSIPTTKFICSQLYNSDCNQLVELIQSLQSDEITNVLFINSSTECIYTYTVRYNDRIKLPEYIDMYMYKTYITEIYNLVDMKNTAYGNAYIPTVEHSKMCKEWFKNIPVDEYLLVKCKNSAMGYIPYKLISNN
jgi:hypothetical protein